MKRQKNIANSFVTLLAATPLILSSCSSTQVSPPGREPSSTKAKWEPAACLLEKSGDKEECILAEKQKLEVLGAYMRYIRMQYGSEIMKVGLKDGALIQFPKTVAKNSFWGGIEKLGLVLLASGGTQGLLIGSAYLATSEPISQGTSFSLFGAAGWKDYTWGGGPLRNSESMQSLQQRLTTLGDKQFGSIELGNAYFTQVSSSIALGGASFVGYFLFGEGYSKENDITIRTEMDRRLEAVAMTITQGLGLPESKMPEIRKAIVEDFLKSFGDQVKRVAAKRKKSSAELSEEELKKEIGSFSYKTNIIELLHHKKILSDLEYKSFLVVSATMSSQADKLRSEKVPTASALVYLNVLEKEIQDLPQDSKDVMALKKDVLLLRKMYRLY